MMTTPIKPDLKHLRILVVDDEPDNRFLIAEIAALYGAHAVQAEDGQVALKLLDDFKPNVILLDLAMPGLDGWELQRRLRCNPALKDVPIIACTALAMTEDAQRAREAGFDGYITKPFKLDRLHDELIRWQAVMVERQSADGTPKPEQTGINGKPTS